MIRVFHYVQLFTEMIQRKDRHRLAHKSAKRIVKKLPALIAAIDKEVRIHAAARNHKEHQLASIDKDMAEKGIKTMRLVYYQDF